MIIIIDNYDSFTYILYQYFRELTSEPVEIIRNDALSPQDIINRSPNFIVIGPGPGKPDQAGMSLDLVKCSVGKIPLLGVCLGHQAIAEAFGARIVQAQRIVHGKAEAMTHDGKGLFRTIPQNSLFTRYHSLAIDESTLLDDFEITARSPDGEIMGIRHKEFILEGVQFHPESIASEHGKKLLGNFLNYRRDAFVVNQQLEELIGGTHWSRHEASEFMTELTEGNLDDIQIAAILTALNAKGITAQEIAGCAEVLQSKLQKIHSQKPVLDTCGTGGDSLGTFNISSMAALLASACGAVVAKHGNRAVSSKCGSADFFQAIGLNINLNPGESEELLANTGFAFLFAPIYHGAMKHAANARKAMKIKTIMNLLGPLVNPASASFQLIGVYDPQLLTIMAEAAIMLGIKRGLVVHGFDGEDEFSVTGKSLVVEFDEQGSIDKYEFDPEKKCSLSLHKPQELLGGNAMTNAELANQLLNGEGSGAIRDAVCLNAGAALYIYGIATTIATGYFTAKTALDSGMAKKKLEDIIFMSQQF